MMLCRKFYRFAISANRKNTTARAFHVNSSSGLRGSAAIRGIPSSVIDIYKALEYECPEGVASAADSREVATAVNGADDTDALLSLGMSKSMALKIIKNRERHRRKFERVEQFLDLDQMSTAKLEREVSKMVMKMKGEEALKSETQADREKTTKESQDSEKPSKEEKKLRRMIAPAIDPDVWEDVETITGIKLSLESVSYAKITKEMELLDWNVIKVVGRSAGKSRANFEFPHLLNAATTATACIPSADAYVLEAPPLILGQKDLMMQLKIHTMRLQSTVAALLSQRFGQQAHRIYEVRYGLREAVLGSEAIGGGQSGLRQRAEKWLLEGEPMSPIYPSMKVHMAEEGLIDVLSDYRLEKDKKEQLAIALVTVASAVHVTAPKKAKSMIRKSQILPDLG